MKAFLTVAVTFDGFVSKNVTVFVPSESPAAVVSVIVPTPEFPSG